MKTKHTAGWIILVTFIILGLLSSCTKGEQVTPQKTVKKVMLANPENTNNLINK